MRPADKWAAHRRLPYKGNVGNLMQHWTLCEVLAAARRHASCLSYVDAHAMAPMANLRTERNDKRREAFNRVRAGRSGRESAYEQSWHRLAPGGTCYPNSAAFVQDVWTDQVSMLLCETDPATVVALKGWAQDRKEVRVVAGDWRDRFEDGLPDAPLTLLSFDPNMYNRHPRERDSRNLYPSDLERTVRALCAVRGGVLVQLSTYAANDGNAQGAVIFSANTILASGGLCLAAAVQVDRQMMSLVYARGLGWSAELAGLPERFRAWLDTYR